MTSLAFILFQFPLSLGVGTASHCDRQPAQWQLFHTAPQQPPCVVVNWSNDFNAVRITDVMQRPLSFFLCFSFNVFLSLFLFWHAFSFPRFVFNSFFVVLLSLSNFFPLFTFRFLSFPVFFFVLFCFVLFVCLFVSVFAFSSFIFFLSHFVSFIHSSTSSFFLYSSFSLFQVLFSFSFLFFFFSSSLRFAVCFYFVSFFSC